MATAIKRIMEDMKTYVIEKSSEKIRITVPASWKVTFGPGVPKQNKYGENNIGWALRFYEATDRQRAIYTNVTGFYDASIKTERLVRVVKQEAKSEIGPKGSKAAETIEKEDSWQPF